MIPYGSIQFVWMEKHTALWLPTTPNLHPCVIVCGTGIKQPKWQTIQLATLCRVGPLKEII